MSNQPFNVGDIISFPKHEESEVELRTASVRYSQGMPGTFMVMAIESGRDGKAMRRVVLERVKDGQQS